MLMLVAFTVRHVRLFCSLWSTLPIQARHDVSEHYTVSKLGTILIHLILTTQSSDMGVSGSCKICCFTCLLIGIILTTSINLVYVPLVTNHSNESQKKKIEAEGGLPKWEKS
jgi:hypothetical protein